MHQDGETVFYDSFMKYSGQKCEDGRKIGDYCEI